MGIKVCEGDIISMKTEEIQKLMNDNWNFNIEEAPKYVEAEEIKVIGKRSFKMTVKKPVTIWATDGKIVTKSYYVLKEERWNCFATGQKPMAWQPYLMPSVPVANTINGEDE